MSQDVNIFDRQLLRQRRDRAANLFAEQDEVVSSAAAELTERLTIIKRDFPLALILGSYGELLGNFIADSTSSSAVDQLVTCDLSFNSVSRVSGLRLVADEETLPFADKSLDLVLSLLSLHLCNDVPGTLAQIQRALKPDGLLLASILGGESLKELRYSFSQAELEIEGGMSPRVAPTIDVQSMGQLMQRVGFALPVVDIERITRIYDTPVDLFRSLRLLGQANILTERKKTILRRKTLWRACEIYVDQFGYEDGRIPATFEIIFTSGWAPHESQQKPSVPGSAETKLADALNTVEQPTGDKAGSLVTNKNRSPG